MQGRLSDCRQCLQAVQLQVATCGDAKPRLAAKPAQEIANSLFMVFDKLLTSCCAPSWIHVQLQSSIPDYCLELCDDVRHRRTLIRLGLPSRRDCWHPRRGCQKMLRGSDGQRRPQQIPPVELQTSGCLGIPTFRPSHFKDFGQLCGTLRPANS